MRIQFSGDRKVCFPNQWELFIFLGRSDIWFQPIPEIVANEFEIDGVLAAYLGDAVHRGSDVDTSIAVLLADLKQEDVPLLIQKLKLFKPSIRGRLEAVSV